MRKILFSLLSCLFILSACSNQPPERDYYLLLMGQSDTWELNGYEIMLTSEGTKVGNGTLTMKEENEYVTDFFRFSTHAVINGEDQPIHESAVAGDTDISEQTTGSIASEGEDHITLEDITSIYMDVEWWDFEQKERIQERIDLFPKLDGETFLD